MDRVAKLVDSHEGIDGLVALLLLSGRVVLHPYVDEDFHGRIEGARHFRFQGHDLAQSDRLVEGYVVDRGGHDHAAAMSMRGDGGGDVHPMQQAASHEVAQRIGVVGQYEFGQDRKRFAGLFSFE
jgi:hypothetical protein